MAYTLVGFFAPLGCCHLHLCSQYFGRHSQIASLRAAVSVAGGAAWFLATYAGPVVSLVRSPFARRSNIALGVAYLILLIAVSWVNSQAVKVEAAGQMDNSGLISGVLWEMVKPLRW